MGGRSCRVVNWALALASLVIPYHHTHAAFCRGWTHNTVAGNGVPFQAIRTHWLIWSAVTLARFLVPDLIDRAIFLNSAVASTSLVIPRFILLALFNLVTHALAKNVVPVLIIRTRVLLLAPAFTILLVPIL
jgi:hypothetical protein